MSGRDNEPVRRVVAAICLIDARRQLQPSCSSEVSAAYYSAPRNFNFAPMAFITSGRRLGAGSH